MKIVYIAASCAPNSGSEDKIGWNVPMQSAKKNRVFVVTMEKQRPMIEQWLSENSVDNLGFCYVDVPDYVKKLSEMLPYTFLLQAWNRRAYAVVSELCKRENIDIVHQITPLEFRSIGNYGRISNVKFVCGPIGGGQKMPRELYSYLTPKQLGTELFRNAINAVSAFCLKYTDTIKNCDFLIYANKETGQYLKDCVPAGTQSTNLVDISTVATELIDLQILKSKHRKQCRFLVIGRLVHLKGHMLLLDALAQLPPDLEYSCMVIGDGCERDRIRKKCSQLGLDNRVIFCGAVPYEQIQDFCDDADALIFPSIRETSGAVILEAMARGLPVVALNKFGAALVLDEDTGWLCDVHSIKGCLEKLKKAVQDCVTDPEERRRRGWNARLKAADCTWENRMATYQSIYDGLVNTKNV